MTNLKIKRRMAGLYSVLLVEQEREVFDETTI